MKENISSYHQNVLEFSLKHVKLETKHTSYDGLVLELSTEFNSDEDKKADRRILKISEISSDTPNTCIFYFGSFKISKIQYYTCIRIDEDKIPELSDIDTIILFDENDIKILIGFIQFSEMGEICLRLDQESIEQLIKQCTYISI